MSDRSEADDGFELAAEAARKLAAVCPEHELLDLFRRTDEVWESFQVRFGKKDISKEKRSCEPAQAYFWASYFIALKAACKENGIDV